MMFASISNSTVYLVLAILAIILVILMITGRR